MSRCIDSNVPCRAPNQTVRSVVYSLVEQGWQACILNNEVAAGKLTQADICSLNPIDLSCCPHPSTQFVQYSRITCPLDQDHQTAPFASTNNPVLRSYDLVAVRPTQPELFAKCCTVLAAQIDIISLDISNKLPFHLRPQLVTQAAANGIVFEICYAEMLQNPAARRQQISNAQQLARALRGRNVILSSQARRPLEIRAVGDVVNLGFLFGFDQSAAQAAVSTNVETMMNRAAARKTDAVQLSMNN